MPFQKFTDSMDIIASLEDKPTVGVNALTSQQLKEKFDEAPNKIKAFINTLIELLANGRAAENIGTYITRNGEKVYSTLQNTVDMLYEAAKNPTIADNSISEQKIKPDAVTGTKIKNGAVTAEKIGANAVSDRFTATIGTSWTGSAAPYTQTIVISEILESDNPIIDVVLPDNFTNAQNILEAYNAVYRFVAGSGSITAYATEATSTEIPIQILCVRK